MYNAGGDRTRPNTTMHIPAITELNSTPTSWRFRPPVVVKTTPPIIIPAPPSPKHRTEDSDCSVQCLRDSVDARSMFLRCQAAHTCACCWPCNCTKHGQHNDDDSHNKRR